MVVITQKLNTEIEQILKQHSGGEAFFDALDMMIRSDVDILRLSVSHLLNNILNRTDSNVLILTGQFGEAVINQYGDMLYKHFKGIVLLPGGLRKSKYDVQVYDRAANGFINLHKTYPDARYYLFDDSFYAGRTRDLIKNTVESLINKSVIRTIVIYDGSIDYQWDVKSLFRYHPVDDKLPF